jgi:hypothetical protein
MRPPFFARQDLSPRFARRMSCAAALLFLAVPAGTQTPPKPQFTGPGSCSSSSCHGSVQPLTETRVLQNEYSTWVVKDRHARAFEVLSSATSERMARILNLGKADQSPRCLSCHALEVPAEMRARTFSPRDGVSCENCHGPASLWLGTHTMRGWTHAQSVQAGMVDSKDLTKRAEQCLSCHLGTAEKFVDHELIAAGHPDLYFELDSFTVVMPVHWKEPRDDAWHGARAWAVGQAVQLREALRQLERRARSGPWPEFAELQCYTCHHALTKPEQSWRQGRGYAGRAPGVPPWNASRYVVVRSFLPLVSADQARQLDADLGELTKLLNRLGSDRAAVGALAEKAARTADQLVQQVQRMRMDAAVVLRAQRQICADADYIAGQGERAAEQAAMSLEALYAALQKNAPAGNAAETRAAIQGLFEQVRNPAAFQPASFAGQMKQIERLLPAAPQPTRR